MKNKILKALKKEGSFRGRTYSIEEMVEWKPGMEEDIPCGYYVCRNSWKKDEDGEHFYPIIIKEFEIKDLEKAIEYFIRIEK